MRAVHFTAAVVTAVSFAFIAQVSAGQAPGAANDPDIPISHKDRVYSAEQFSNTVSVTDPVDNKLLGAIHLGDPLPGVSVRCMRGNCWCTASDSRPITAQSRLSPSVRML